MKTLVYIENNKGKAAKSSLEALSYAIALNGGNAEDVLGVMLGAIEGDGGTGVVGLKKLINVSKNADSAAVSVLLVDILKESGADILVMSHDNGGKEIAPRVAVSANMSLISGVTQLGTIGEKVVIKRNVFSGKAISEVVASASKVVVTVLPNSFGVKRHESEVNIQAQDSPIKDSIVHFAELKGNHEEGGIPLPEADIVVSGGRGMKGPEHWAPVEELAKLLGGATACSRPVSDIGWRPHHEHVGQTGIAIRPNLYIAVGISGAIQHLAGVNGSKVIVVINKDPEAPFFKAADYGIVGDAFEVLPKIIDAAKAYNATK